jgi:hypothetical protein
MHGDQKGVEGDHPISGIAIPGIWGASYEKSRTIGPAFFIFSRWAVTSKKEFEPSADECTIEVHRTAQCHGCPSSD